MLRNMIRSIFIGWLGREFDRDTGTDLFSSSPALPNAAAQTKRSFIRGNSKSELSVEK